MSDRRRLLLMAALNNGVWLPYSYEYLYHDLIPTDINGGEVKNKARVSKVYANGVVENQLIANDKGNQSSSGIDLEYLGNGQWRVHGTASSNVAFQLSNGTYTFPVGHKFLLKVKGLESSNVSNCAIRYMGAGFNTITSIICTGVSSASAANQLVDGTDYPRIFVASGQTVDYTFTCEVIDLTQMFPFDTPTILTDKRVQNILARGYIPYNTGTYKGTDIGVVSSEPYNLLGLDRTAGTLNGSSNSHGNKQDFSDTKYYAGLSTTDYVHQTAVSYVNISGSTISFLTNDSAYGVGLPIRVVGGKSYTLEIGSSTNSGDVYISFYDENGMFISSSIANSSVTAPNDAYWGVIILIANTTGSQITYTNICLHRTGTRTGYAKHETLTPIIFKYQGNGAGTSHDTYEITKTEHVFTKKNSKVDLESLTWVLLDTGTNNKAYYSNFWNYYSTDGSAINMISYPEYKGATNVNSVQADSLAKGLYTTNSAGNNRNTIVLVIGLNDSISGSLAYELATPQVIRIPRKHLGIVDLGSLEWTYQSSEQRFVSIGVSGLKAGSRDVPLYCSLYMLQTTANLSENMVCYVAGNTNNLYIQDHKYNDATAFKSAMSGIYLFYETEDEVADINNIVDIESGGTITSDSEVLPNVDFDIKCKKPQQTGALGTWVFNNTIDITDMLDKTIDINFTCNNVSYTSMQFFREYDDDMWLYYGYYGNTMVYGSTSATGSLLDANYKTITITGGTDATTPSFIAWLEANATKQ